MVLELKKLGIELNMSPQKLKNGFGEETCIVLRALTDLSVKNKIKFRRPQIRDEGGQMDDEADDMDDDLDGRADMADEVHADVEDEEIDEEMDFGGGLQYDMAK